MADLQVAYLRDVMPVTRIEPVDTSVPSIRILGRHMSSATVVLINGLESPLFIPISDSEVIAEIPTSIVNDLIRSVAVLSNRMGTAERAVLVFRLGGASSKVSGIQRLVQRYVLMLLTSPGSALLNPTLGGGLLKFVGKAMGGVSTNDRIAATVQQSVTKAAEDIRKIQATSSGLTAAEKLVSAQLAGVQFDARTTTLAIRVIVDSAAGRSALANLFV